MEWKEFEQSLQAVMPGLRFKCYTLVSQPHLIKVILFGKDEWTSCYIGFLIDKHFHVLGLDSFSFINEDAKALYVTLTCLPEDEQVLKVMDFTLLDEEQQKNIKEKLNEIYPNL